VQPDDESTAMRVAPTPDPERWVDQHGDALYRYALLRLRDADRAADLVQETFAEALRAQATFSGRSSERTWLVAILKHKLIDHLRRTIRGRGAGDAEEAAKAADDSFDERGFWRRGPARWGGDASQALERREFWEVLHCCLDGLPAPLAETFFLRELDGLDADEVCRLCDITPANLWTRLHRARLALRRCLEVRWFGKKDDR
jgi:RNA polymerase sigma-70 factor (ECF subfamily)